MDSELELNDEIQKLHVIATVPHLYHHIVEVNAVGTILGLLSHENSGRCRSLVHVHVETVWPSDKGAGFVIRRFRVQILFLATGWICLWWSQVQLLHAL